MSDAILEVRNLDAHYGEFKALFDVSLHVSEGEVLAIIGSNGAGKSTLLNSIVGLIKNQPEMIRYRGEAIGDLDAFDVVARGISLVPEGRRLFPSLSVEENLIIGGENDREGRWSLEEIYELFPILKELRHQQSTSLSGGQQQMTAIGRALLANPDLILFDEISLGLAPVVIKDIYTILPNIVKDGMSAIIVEQDIHQALAASHRVVCLQEGHVSLEGATDEVTRDEITNAYFGFDVA